MHGNPVGKWADGDVEVYSVDLSDGAEKQPLLDLRTRLVLWVLCLVFFGLVYWGLNAPMV